MVQNFRNTDTTQPSFTVHRSTESYPNMKFVCILIAIVASVAAQPVYLRETGHHGSFAANVGYQVPIPRLPELGLGVDSFPVPFPTISQRFITVPLPALEYPQPKLYSTRY